MAGRSPKERAVSNLLALVDQSEGLKTQARERRWRVKKEEKEQLEGEKRNEETDRARRKEERRRRAARDKSLTWRGIQSSSLNISSRPGGGIQLRSGYSHSTAGECAAHAIFCCKVNRSLFGRCCI